MRRRASQKTEELALFALPGVCLMLLAFAVAGLGFFFFGHFGRVDPMEHFGKVLMAPFGFALGGVVLVEMSLWLCALIIYAIGRKRGWPAKTEDATQARSELIETNADEPEQTGARSTAWQSVWAYIIVFSAVLALFGLVPLLRGVYQQERGLIVIGTWLVAPYGSIVAAWYIAIQVWHLTSGVYQMRKISQTK